MLRPRIAHYAWGAALAAALACNAAGQTADFAKRLIAGQDLRAHDRFLEARVIYRTLLQDVRKDGSDYRFEALVLDNLALDEQDIGDYAAAETAFNHALTAVQAEPAADHKLIGLKSHLAELYIAEVRPADAEPLLRQAMAALRSSAPPDPIALSEASEDLAVVCMMQRKFTEPEALLRESQSLLESAIGPDSPRLTASLLTYAGFLTAVRRYAEAVAPAERAWQLLHTGSVLVPKPYLASALSVLGAVYYHSGRTWRR